MTYNVTYLMFDAIYQVQTFAMLFSSGGLNECEVGSLRYRARDWTLWPGVGQSVAIRPVNSFLHSLSSDYNVVIFFSGHGMEEEGENYLMPADADPNPHGQYFKLLQFRCRLAVCTIPVIVGYKGVSIHVLITASHSLSLLYCRCGQPLTQHA